MYRPLETLPAVNRSSSCVLRRRSYYDSPTLRLARLAHAAQGNRGAAAGCPLLGLELGAVAQPLTSTTLRPDISSSLESYTPTPLSLARGTMG
jgi:hypothetical protein